MSKRNNLMEVDIVPNAPDQELVEVVTAAVIQQFIETFPTISETLMSNAYEMIVGTIEPEEMPMPARYEDVEAFSKKIVDQVCADGDFKNQFVKMVSNIIESMMEPY